MAVFVDDLQALHPVNLSGMERFFVLTFIKRRTTMKIIYKDGHLDECPQDQELHVIRHTAAHIMAHPAEVLLCALRW